MVRKYIKELGIAADLKELHPHALRHFCATRLLRSGIDIRKIQIHLGHSDIASTTRYTHMMGSEVQKEINELYSTMENDVFPKSETAENKGVKKWVQIPTKSGNDEEGDVNDV